MRPRPMTQTNIVWADAAAHYSRGRRFPLTAPLPVLTTAPLLPLPFTLNAVVESVGDGDTITVTVDWGKRRREVKQPIRLIGIAAREKSDPGGQEAITNLTALLPVGTLVALSTIKDDKFAPRWDCQVAYILGGEMRDLGADLVEQGWAAPWDGRGRQPKPAWPRVPSTVAFAA